MTRIFIKSYILLYLNRKTRHNICAICHSTRKKKSPPTQCELGKYKLFYNQYWSKLEFVILIINY